MIHSFFLDADRLVHVMHGLGHIRHILSQSPVHLQLLIPFDVAAHSMAQFDGILSGVGVAVPSLVACVKCLHTCVAVTLGGLFVIRISHDGFPDSRHWEVTEPARFFGGFSRWDK